MMSSRLRRQLGGLGMCGLLLGSLGAAPDGDWQPDHLDSLVLLGHDRPEAALRALDALDARGAPAGVMHDLLFARALVEAQRPQHQVQARALAERLRRGGSAPLAGRQASARADLVEAIAADSAGRVDLALQLAQRSVNLLETDCPAQVELPNSCDYRTTWLALQTAGRQQIGLQAYARAQALLQRAAQLAEAAGDELRQAQSLSASALALAPLAPQGRQEIDALLTRAHQLARPHPAAWMRVRLDEADVEQTAGRSEVAVAALLDTLHMADSAGVVRIAAAMRLRLSGLLLKLGRPAASLLQSQGALPVLQSFKDSAGETRLRLNMALALARSRQPLEAMAQLNALRRLPDHEAALSSQSKTLCELGRALAEQGHYRQALELYHLDSAIAAANRKARLASAMRELELRNDSQRKQTELDLLQRSRALKAEALANHSLLNLAWISVAAVLALSLLISIVLIRRVRMANRLLADSHTRLREQSERDALTGLPNRGHFMSVMAERAAVHFEGALLMVDIDHFKQINDQHGHSAGDAAIQAVARRLDDTLREQDLVVRWGGEEFLVYVPELGFEPLAALSDRLLNSIAGQSVDVGPTRVALTASIGFASFPLPPHHVPLSWSQAANFVDLALYAAKTRGRNRAVGLRSCTVRSSEELRSLEADFPAGCAQGQVLLEQVLGPQPAREADTRPWRLPGQAAGS